MTDDENLFDLIIKTITKRPLMSQNTNAYRLFNGHFEGLPGLILDRYGQALVIFDYGDPGAWDALINEVTRWSLDHLDGLEAVLHKQRQHPEPQMKQGTIIAGSKLPNQITEHGLNYAIDLQMHQDASFYLDTRYLRRWLKENMSGKRVLNTFAYTGSLGVAAGFGGAALVAQTDLSEKFLRIAEQSWSLNDLPQDRCQIIAGDFFRIAGQMRNHQRLFDCVILDPPFFSTTDAGRVDLLGETTRLVNKVRPLIAHQGWLVVINNALYYSGSAFMAELEKLCQSKYLTLEKTIPIPADVTGYPDTILTQPPVDPAPFNHPTKIAILKVTRKDEHK
jgi:23S rRNA (cytosine1962-C5)-methyltransferase